MKTKVTTPVNEINNEMLDSRIVRLNEMKAVLMAKISKSKRPAAKANKVAAQYILENWDNVEALKSFCSDASNQEAYETYCIAKSRVDQLSVPEKEEAPAEVKLTDKEQSALEILIRNDNGEGFEETVYVDFQTIAGFSQRAAKGLFKSLQGKRMIEMNGGEAYYLGRVTELGFSTYKKLAYEIAKEENLTDDQKKVIEEATQNAKATVEVEVGSGKSGKAKKADSKKAEPKAKEEKQSKVKAPKTARKVGDVHPNHPTWVWTEYATGKFDWRTNPSDKKKVGAKPGAPKQPKEADTKAKFNKKASKANTTKGANKKAVPAPKKEFKLEDWKAMPKVSAKGLSKAQAEAQKLISKGFWIWNNGGHHFFKNEAGETKSCDMKTIEALFSRYGKGIPTDLIK